MGVFVMEQRQRRHVPTTEAEYEITVRAAAIGWRLAQGETLTAKIVSEDYGIALSAAHRLLKRIARGVQIYEENHKWRKLPRE